LRDGSSECLWYAVSGTYKNNPKQVLANDTDGLFIVKNADNVIIAPDTPEERAIAVIFAPGKPIGGQDRRSTGNATICGKDAIADDATVDNAIAGNYLDTFTNGINNATGNGTLKEDSSFSANFLVTTDSSNKSTFIQSPLKKQGVEVIFNDTLMLITPKDFEYIYSQMDFWVAKQVAQCLKEYGKQYTRDILSQHETDIANYRTTYATQIQNYLDAHGSTQCEKQCSEVCPDCDVKCESKCNCQSTCEEDCQLECGTGDSECKAACQLECEAACQPECDLCQSKCELDKIARQNECDLCKSDCEQPFTTSKKYPWASNLLDSPPNYIDNVDARFGRSPDNMNQSISAISEVDLSSSWATVILNGKPCFKGDGNTVHFEDYEWEWWNEWREEVFFAVDEHHEPSATTTYIWVKNSYERTLCTLSKIIADDISECPNPTKRNRPQNKLTREYKGTETRQSLVVIVAGRKLASQERTSHAEKVRIDNYLESDNIPGTGASDTIPPGNEIFMSKWATDDFNDAVCGIRECGIDDDEDESECGIGGIESSGEIFCVDPPE
jgi:hypothetical protein